MTGLEASEAAKNALTEIGIVGMNVFQVRGRGRDGGITVNTRSGAYVVDMIPKVQINIILSDDNVETTIDTIKASASTGTPGDGLLILDLVAQEADHGDDRNRDARKKALQNDAAGTGGRLICSSSSSLIPP